MRPFPLPLTPLGPSPTLCPPPTHTHPFAGTLPTCRPPPPPAPLPRLRKRLLSRSPTSSRPACLPALPHPLPLVGAQVGKYVLKDRAAKKKRRAHNAKQAPHTPPAGTASQRPCFPQVAARINRNAPFR